MAFDGFSCSSEENAGNFYFNAQGARKSEAFQVGQGFVAPSKASGANPRGGPSRLRFGAGSFVQELEKKNKPASSGVAAETKAQQKTQRHRDLHVFGEGPKKGKGASASFSAGAASASASPADHDPEGVDQDLYPLHLSAEASHEFRRAAQCAESGAADMASQLVDDAASKPARGACGVPFYHPSLGITGLGLVKRGGVKCYHCSGSVEKSEMRFEFVHDKKKPPRCIHTGCLVQMNDEQRLGSLQKLDSMLLQSDLSPPERHSCEEALSVLRSLGPPQ